MLDSLVLILVIVGGSFCCLFSTCWWFLRVFLINRRKAVKTVPIKYLPDVVIEREIIPTFVRIKSKREKRKQKIKEIKAIVEVPTSELNKYTEEEEEEIIAASPPPKFNIRSSIMSRASFMTSSKMLNNIRKQFIQDYNENGDDENDDTDLEMGNTRENAFGKSTKSRKTEIETSSKSKRFVSQDRLHRAELRRSLIRTQSKKYEKILVQEVVEEGDNIISLLDLERIKQEKVAIIIAQRKEVHKELKKNNALNGIIDVVAINSGPPMSILPAGYVTNDTVPQLTPSELTGKRIMLLWEPNVNENPRNITGWFLGSISGPSKMKGCNFNVKYDRAETGNLFVDGVRNMNLTLSGENAYGRRWVIVNKMNQGGGSSVGDSSLYTLTQPSGLQQASLQQSTKQEPQLQESSIRTTGGGSLLGSDGESSRRIHE